MKIAVVTAEGARVGDKCHQCRRTVKVNDVIAWCRTDNFTKPFFTMHIKCMAELVDKAGELTPQAAFDELRNRIVEVGSVWV